MSDMTVSLLLTGASVGGLWLIVWFMLSIGICPGWLIVGGFAVALLVSGCRDIARAIRRQP